MTDALELPDFGIRLVDFKAIEEIPLELSAELDHRLISVPELLKLQVDSLLLLNRPTGENIDVYVGDVLIASAEILVVDGTLAVRIADLKDKTTLAKATHVHDEDPFLDF